MEGLVLRISAKLPDMDHEEVYQGDGYHRVGTFRLSSYGNIFLRRNKNLFLKSGNLEIVTCFLYLEIQKVPCLSFLFHVGPIPSCLAWNYKS